MYLCRRSTRSSLFTTGSYRTAHGLRLDRRMADQDTKRVPLDGSVSGTIGAGGRESGGPTERPAAPDMPKVKPENAASGRMAPDAVDAANPKDELKPGP